MKGEDGSSLLQKTSSVQSRLVANFSANTCARGVGASLQIVSVPVLIHCWGAELYAEWILLSTIPAYLTMSDVGFGTVAGNEMTMLFARGEVAKASAVFQSVHLLISAISLFLAVIGAILLCALPLDHWLHLGMLAGPEYRRITALLGLSSLTALQANLFQQGFRAIGRAATGVLLKSSTMLTLLAGILITAWAGGTPQAMAWIFLLINGCGTLLLWFVLQREAKWIRLGFSIHALHELRRLARPAISFMSFPVSELLNQQGLLILLGHLLGPAAVLVFSTARTVARSGQQVLQLVSASVWPEVSAAFGAGNRHLLRHLHRRACQVSLLVCLSMALLMLASGASLWRSWTLGRVTTDPSLLRCFLVQMALGSIWYTSAVVLAATNRHGKVAGVICACSCSSIILAACFVRAFGMGAHGAVLALIAGDGVACVFVVRESLRLTQDTLSSMGKALFSLPESLAKIRNAA